jgi:hypothetical protein
MLDYDRESISQRNVHQVRVMYPVQFLQVRPSPTHPDNVQLRIGTGEWTTLHVVDALRFTRLARNYQRRILKAPAELKRRRDALLKKGITP